MVNMVRTVFFADVLGFSSMSRTAPDLAVDALSDIATLLSADHPVATYLNRHPWEERYALSDSIFLVGLDPVEACKAVAEFFFNLAFYVAEADHPVLLRGAVAHGEIQYAPPIFPTTTSNLVGEAVVEAVTLERMDPKGPRLYVSGRVAEALQMSPLHDWLLSPATDSLSELLWLLPADPSEVNPTLIARVAKGAARWFERSADQPRSGVHYVGYLELVVRSLLRLRERAPAAAAEIQSQLELSHLLDSAASLPATESRERLLGVSALYIGGGTE